MFTIARKLLFLNSNQKREDDTDLYNSHSSFLSHNSFIQNPEGLAEPNLLNGNKIKKLNKISKKKVVGRTGIWMVMRKEFLPNCQAKFEYTHEGTYRRTVVSKFTP